MNEGIREWSREDVYDAAAERWGDKAAVVNWGDRFIIGRWVRLNVAIGDVCERHGHGIEVLGEGSSWMEAARRAGLFETHAEAAQ